MDQQYLNKYSQIDKYINTNGKLQLQSSKEYAKRIEQELQYNQQFNQNKYDGFLKKYDLND